MALAEAPPLAVEDSTGSWTAAEIEEAAALCERADADGSRWALADWLLRALPMGEMGRADGSWRRIDELAARVGVAGVTLRQARATAHSWPPSTRLPAAAYHVHEKYRNGGAEHASERRERLLAVERNAAGRITTPAFQRWRAAQRADGAPTSPKRRGPVALPAYADVLERIDELVTDVDQLVRCDGRPQLWTGVRAQLDSLSGEVERIAVVLSAAA